MEEMNHQDLENEESININETNISPQNQKKPWIKIIVIASAACVLVAAIVLLLIFVVFKHEHEWSEWEVETKATYSVSGSQTRHCINGSCDEIERKSIEPLGDNGVYQYLNGRWREKGASKEDFLIDILFEDDEFTAEVYIDGREYSYMGGTGTVEITEELITLKNDNGGTYIYFIYEIGNNTIVLIDYDFSVWEKYEP